MGTQLQRPRALSREVQQRIITLLAEGNYLFVACEAAGLTYSGFRHWQRRWEDGDPVAQEFADFFESVKRAVAVGEVNALRELTAGDPGWQSRAWFLERRFPQRWGRKDRTPVQPKPPKPIDQMTPDELDAYERSLDAGKGRR